MTYGLGFDILEQLRSQDVYICLSESFLETYENSLLLFRGNRVFFPVFSCVVINKKGIKIPNLPTYMQFFYRLSKRNDLIFRLFAIFFISLF